MHPKEPQPARASRPWLRRAGLVAAPLWVLGVGVFAGCSNPERILAREIVDGAAPRPPTLPRARVQVVDGVLVSDRGTPLRGVTIPFDLDPDFPLDAALLRDLTRATGLNLVKAYVENWQLPAAAREAQVDRLVDLAATAGAYVIVALGGGPDGGGHPGNGWFDPATVRAFWSHYAPRYAERTHVLYEIQNNPELGCTEPLAPATLAMQREAYALIRQHAPETHVVMFSFSAVPTPAALRGSVQGLAGEVDFRNASSGMHAIDECVQPAAFAAVRDEAAALGVPVFASELDNASFEPYLRVIEANRIGWTSHAWLSIERSTERLRQELEAAAVTWCPDFGIWPEDAARCAR